MGNTKVLLRGLFVAGLVMALYTYGLAAQSATKNQNQGAATSQNQATARPGAAQQEGNEPPPGGAARAGAATSSSQMGRSMMLVRTSQLIGKPIKSAQGDTLGTVQDIVVTPDHQQVAYVALSSGGTAGPSSKLYALPWQALRVSANGDITTAITKDRLSQAPGFTNSYWPSQADTRWLSAATGATGSSAAGSSATGSATAGSTAGGQAAAGAPAGQSSSATAGQTAMGGQDVQFRRVTHLTGTEVKNTQNEDLGDIEDFTIDTTSGHLTYDIVSLSTGDKMAAIPSSAIQIQPQTHTAIVNASKQTLDSVAFASGQFPNLGSPEYMQRVSKLFPAAPSGGALGYVPSQTPQTQQIADQKVWGADGLHGKAFNSSTVKTITGTVESVGTFKPQGATAGASPGLRLRVKTSSGNTVTVFAGPTSFAEQHNFFVMPGDQISITGSQTTIRSRTVVLASEIKKGGQTLELRDKTGKPLWTTGSAMSSPQGARPGAGAAGQSSSSSRNRTE